MHWTTAGSGIVHEETPVDVGKACLGLQVFVNLPPELKNVAPRWVVTGPSTVAPSLLLVRAPACSGRVAPFC